MTHSKEQNIKKLEELVQGAKQLAEIIDLHPDPLYKHKADLVKQTCFEANQALEELREEM